MDDCTHWPCVSSRHTIELINPGISHTTIHNPVLVTSTSFDPHMPENNTARYPTLSYCKIAIPFPIMVDVIHGGDRREHNFGALEALRAEVSTGSAPPQPSATANSNMHHMHRPACHPSKFRHLLPVPVRCRASLDPRDLILNSHLHYAYAQSEKATSHTGIHLLELGMIVSLSPVQSC